MKKHSLILALALGLITFRGHGQGTVTFGNNSSSAISNILSMQRIVAGTTFRVSLYYLPDQPVAPTPSEMLALASPIGASSIIQPAAGLFAAGTRTTPSTTPGAGFAWFQVRAWEAAFGTSYEAVVNNTTPQGGRLGCAGTSNIIRVKTGDPINNIAPGALTAFGLQGFFVCTPEPSSYALAAMGVGAWLLLRFRKGSPRR
jgi:hypothetical protein